MLRICRGRGRWKNRCCIRPPEAGLYGVTFCGSFQRNNDPHPEAAVLLLGIHNTLVLVYDVFNDFHTQAVGLQTADLTGRLCRSFLEAVFTDNGKETVISVNIQQHIAISYTFDAFGIMQDAQVSDPEVIKEGVYAESGSLYYYVDGIRNYAGLIKYTGDLHAADGSVIPGVYNNNFIYVNTQGEVKNQCTYWITKTNGYMEAKSCTFGEYGIMQNVPTSEPGEEGKVKDGIVPENGSLYYYVDGVLTYAGLIEKDGNYYYVKTNGEVVNNRSYWITKTNGLMKAASYNFDGNGVMTNPDPLTK